MTLNLAICDDETEQIEHLCLLVADWAKESRQLVHVDTYPSAEAFLFIYGSDKHYDILLLDIQMGKMDGVTLARQIRAVNKEIQIIFITGYMEYIADGYDVEALHYLLKPTDRNKLFAVLDRAVEKLKSNEMALIVNQGGEVSRIPLYDIRYLEVRHNYVTIHANHEYTIKKPLAEFAKELDDSFFRTGRSFVVNLRYIRKITRTEVFLEGDIIVPLSRGLYDDLNRALITHI